MSLKNVPTTKCHKECLTQSAHVFVLGRPKSRKKSPRILLLDMWQLKSAQEKQNVNRARVFLRMLCHYEFTFTFFKENILLVHTISEIGGAEGKKISPRHVEFTETKGPTTILNIFLQLCDIAIYLVKDKLSFSIGFCD